MKTLEMSTEHRLTTYLNALMRAPNIRERVTPRELEVWREIALGVSRTQVATALGISVKTVDNHVANLKEKLGVDNHCKLVLLAVRYGVVGVPLAPERERV